jgi:protein ImuB
VLVQAGAHGLRLAACSAAARARGLKTGERFADARARVPDLVSRLHEPDKDAAMLLKLMRWSERWSPFIAPDPPDGMVLDVTGIAHLFGGEAALLADMAAKFRRLGFTINLALAGTAAAAWALARYCAFPPLEKGRVREGIDGASPKERRRPVNPHPALRADLPLSGGGEEGFSEAPPSPFPIVAPGEEYRALETLPVEALGLELETCQTLRQLGLKRIGQLHDLPRVSLARRFRNDLTSSLMVKLDQALGRAEAPIAPLNSPPVLAVREAVIEPLVSAEGVKVLIEHLAHAFCARLESAGRSALRLLVKLYRVDGSRAVIPVGLAQGCHDPSHLARLIVFKLEDLDLGYGIEAGTMEAVETAAVAPAQADFLAGRIAPGSSLVELADRILNRYERLALARLEAAESHVPERAEIALPPTLTLPHEGGRVGGGGLRPILLLDRPEPVVAIAAVPDGPPVRFTWRRVARQVVRAEGPERIAPEWWRDGTGGTRDYYVIEDHAGRRYWLFREGLYGEEKQPAWFIHGLFA